MKKEPKQPPIVTEYDIRIKGVIDAFVKNPEVLDLGQFEFAGHDAVRILEKIARGINEVLWNQKSDTPIKVILPKNLDLEQLRFFRDSFLPEGNPNARITALVFPGIVPGTKSEDIQIPFTDDINQYTQVLTYLGFNKDKLPKNEADEAFEILLDLNHAVRKNMEKEMERNRYRAEGKKIRDQQINFAIGALEHDLTELLLRLPLQRGKNEQKERDKVLTYELLGFIRLNQKEIADNQNFLIEKIKEILNRTERNSKLNQKLNFLIKNKISATTFITTTRPAKDATSTPQALSKASSNVKIAAAAAQKAGKSVRKAEPSKSFASKVFARLKALLPSEKEKQRKQQKRQESLQAAKAEYRTMIATKRADADWAQAQAEIKRRQAEVVAASEESRRQRIGRQGGNEEATQRQEGQRQEGQRQEEQSAEIQHEDEFHPGRPLIRPEETQEIRAAETPKIRPDEAHKIHAARQEAHAAKHTSRARQTQAKFNPNAFKSSTMLDQTERDLLDFKMTMLNALRAFINKEQEQQIHWYSALFHSGRKKQIDLAIAIMPKLEKAEKFEGENGIQAVLSESIKLKPGVPLYNILDEGLKASSKLKPEPREPSPTTGRKPGSNPGF